MRSLDIVRQKQPEIFHPSLSPSPSRGGKWERKLRIAIAMLLVVALIGLGLFLYLPRATLIVKARTEPVTRSFEIRVDENISSPQSQNSTALAVPGKIIEHETSGQQNFPATGAKNMGKQASGFVLIYNFSKTTLILKKDTTALTANGRTYRFTQDVSGIRPTARIGLEDEEIDPTSLIPPVPVVADGPGEEYNLVKNARLEIQNEAFGSQPQKLYAIAADGISGGTTSIVKFISQSDIDKSFQSLAGPLLEKARAESASQNSGSVILSNALSQQILEQTASLAAGTDADEFESRMRVKIRALAFAEDDVKAMVRQIVERLLPPKKILSEKNSRLDYSFLSINLGEGAGVLGAHFQGQIVYRLDEKEILEQVRAKSAEEIREIILSQPEVDSLEVQFSPFWVKRAPKLRSQIKVTAS